MRGEEGVLSRGKTNFRGKGGWERVTGVAEYLETTTEKTNSAWK